MTYIELHTHSGFSFLEGASQPEDLVDEAARLGYPALALLDRDGVYGAPRFHKACREKGMKALVGAELTVQYGQIRGALPLLAETAEGYRNLCGLITNMKLRSQKGQGQIAVEELRKAASGLVCLTGGMEGVLHGLLSQSDKEGARHFLSTLRDIFGSQSLFVEVQRHFIRQQENANQTAVELAKSLGLPLLASNGVRQARIEDRPLLDVLTCIRHKTHLDQAGRLLLRNAEQHLKAPAEVEALFSDLPEAVRNSGELAQRLDFTLENLGYRFPEYPVPPGENMSSYLRKLTDRGARERYRPYSIKAQKQVARELDLIEKLDLAGYFLIVWDLVQFCRREGILAQGRGSAANSAVCYSLGITAVDPVGMDLLFERFLSEERGEWPDIDLDLPSGDRRERVIQYVYDKYGERGAAMTANVITYRGRSAAREVGKALGFPPDILDRLSKLLNGWGLSESKEILAERFKEAGLDVTSLRVRKFLELWRQIQDLPRHLGQHSGGMVIAQGRLDSVVPLENASMPGRKVIQWDKEDCADLGIIKVDLLGLGMMSALQDCLQILSRSGKEVDLAHLPQDSDVYRMLQKADTVGVFQVESRAQMATLPRLKPERFYDLVVQVAIIRPGPIVGQMVHPYLQRRAGREPVQYPHPCLEPILERTLGVPLFQEQLLRIAMVAAGFTGGEAEELRRAMGFKRSEARMQKIEAKLRQGMATRGITGETADSIIRSIASFALYGFPESHAASFALLAYASANLKCRYPAAFYTALLNNQPMGFYHPATLVKDAQAHGRKIRPVDVQNSDWLCTVGDDDSVRLGLMYVRGLRQRTGLAIERARHERPFASVRDLLLRTRLNKTELVTLAEIGALNSLGMKRREALWQVAKASRPGGPLFDREVDSPGHSPLADMTPIERLSADFSGTGLTLGPHPVALMRRELDGKGVKTARQLRDLEDGRRVKVAGGVIVRQRPGTAKGFVFLSLEDETGIANIIVRPQIFERNRLLLINQPFLLVEGILQNQDGVVSVRAEIFQPLGLAESKDDLVRSHNFY